MLYKSGDDTPVYSPDTASVGPVLSDMEGQKRLSLTAYGADEFSSDTAIYFPLTPGQVGPFLGDYLSLSQSELNFGEAGGEESVYIASNLDWEVIVDEDWISVNPGSGSGDSIILVSVTKNENSSFRQASIRVVSDETFTRIVEIKQDGITGTEEELIINDAGFKIYPNPSNGFFNIEGFQGKLLTIYTTQGQMVFQQEINHSNETLSSGLPAGIYILSFKGEAREQQYKIVIRD